MVIPDFGASLPKQYRSEGVGDIPMLGIKRLFRMLILGPSYSGKNNLVAHMLKLSPNIFSHLHIVARNPDQEIYEFLRDKLNGFITIHDPDNPPPVDAIRHDKAGRGIELVVVDDYSNDALLQKNLFSHYFTRGRHHRLSTVFLSHSYFATSKMIRLNSEYVSILKANSKRDLKMIFKDFNIPKLTEERLYSEYVASTANKGQMLLIDSVKGQIRHNFDKVTEL